MVWRRSSRGLHPRWAVATRGREEGNSSCQEHGRPRVAQTSLLHKGYCAASTPKNGSRGFQEHCVGPLTPMNCSFGGPPSAKRLSSAVTARWCRSAGRMRWTTRSSSVSGGAWPSASAGLCSSSIPRSFRGRTSSISAAAAASADAVVLGARRAAARISLPRVLKILVFVITFLLQPQSADSQLGCVE